VYLSEGYDMPLKEAIRRLYDEGVISIYNVHVRNVIFNLCEVSSEPKIEWRKREING
jgi:hypothetical protein